MPLLDQKLDKQWADSVMHEKITLLLAVIHELEKKGREIAKDIDVNSYASLDDYFKAHDDQISELVKLEGKSARKGNMVYLKNCPMKSLLGKTAKGGELPRHFDAIVEKWKMIYKAKGAVLHPYCIVHQVIRTHVAERINIGGKKARIYQVACASADGNKVAFAEEGLKKYNLTAETARGMVKGCACMYGIDKSFV